MELIRTLADISSSGQQDLHSVGGKGANLGALIRAGFPVPPGFVLLTNAYQYFIHTNGFQEEIERLAQQVTPEDITSFERASQAIRALFERGTMPEEIALSISQAYQQPGAGVVAIRSSATTEDLPAASFAGLHESYLNVCSFEDILMTVRQCWASLWTPRALSYRTRLGIVSQTVSMAVVIQQMVQASISGVLFTINPVSGVHDEVVINATLGSGEALVAGQITPDSITVEKASGRIKQQEVGTPSLIAVPSNSRMGSGQVETAEPQHLILADEQVAQLVRLGERIEEQFGVPQDIEWAIADEQVFIVQARPITTHVTTQPVPVYYGTPLPPGDDAWNREHDLPPKPYDMWTRVNVGENLPYPVTPLTETGFPVLFGLNNDTSEQQSFQMTRRLYGRMYFNEGAIFYNLNEEMGLPASWMHKMWGSRQRGTQVYKNTFRPLRLLRKLFSMLTTSFKTKKKEKTPRHTPEQFFAQIDQWVNEFMRNDLSKLSQLDDGQLWNEGLPTWSKRGAYAFATNLRFGITAGVSYGLLERVVRWWTGKEMAQELVTSLSGIYSAEVGPALWRMAQMAQESGVQDILLTQDPITALNFLRSHEEGCSIGEQLEAFLARHGHRCPNELELRNPRWAEAPEQVIELIANYLRAGERVDPSVTESRQQQRRTDAVTIVEAKLDPLRRAIFRFLLKQAQRAVTVRDNSRYYMANFIFPTRKMYAELGRRWMVRGWLKQVDDIFFLTLAEIEGLIEKHPTTLLSDTLRTTVEQRRLAYEFWFTVVAPDALGADGAPIIEEEEHLTMLKGIPASGGTIRGRVRIVQTIQEAMSLRPGDILVTTATDPGWTPIFPLVSGIVLEIGGQLSHGAIIAREYGIPAVVNVSGAMRLIHDGQLIEVDGSKGVITLL
ncbi:MAG: PEP/pyruvate-binding domain-containing protein [Ktedonobacteraceae bacterium]